MSEHQLQHYEGPGACGKYELPGVLDNCNLVMRVLRSQPDGEIGHPTIGYDWASVYNQDNLENIRIATHKGRVISSAAIVPCRINTPRGALQAAGINCFATHPDYRRRGIGTAVLEDAHRKIRESGFLIGLLVTGIYDFYRKFAWEKGGTEQQFWLDRGNINRLPDPQSLEITEDWTPWITSLYDMHAKETVFAERSPDLQTVLFQHRLHRVFVVIQNGSPFAYAAFRGNFLWEYGGDADAVAALIRHAFQKMDDPVRSVSDSTAAQKAFTEMIVRGPVYPHPLTGILQDLGVPCLKRDMGMIRIFDPPGLWSALDLTEVDLQKSEKGWRLTAGSKVLDVSEHGLVKLVFGPERNHEFKPDLFPIDFYQWPLDVV